eukprot:16443877-Heterocapsa_arctica.AAC.1
MEEKTTSAFLRVHRNRCRSRRRRAVRQLDDHISVPTEVADHLNGVQVEDPSSTQRHVVVQRAPRYSIDNRLSVRSTLFMAMVMVSSYNDLQSVIVAAIIHE